MLNIFVRSSLFLLEMFQGVRINDPGETVPSFKGFHHQKFEKSKDTGPKISFDFSKHVLIELLDDSTPEAELWKELGLLKNKNVVRKRMMIDSHRVKCRRAIVMCVDSNAAKELAEHLSQARIMKRCICAVVIEDLMSDLRLFEKQIIQFGDRRPQHQLVFVSDLSRPREPAGLVRFLKEVFSPFGTILSVFVSAASDGYAYPEGIIKFAYLSEAFAAELALDQYVVGMERLSVTSHHNTLLSQCDLRLRLRSAQWSNFSEYDSMTKTHLLPYDYELNQLSMHDTDLINSVSNLFIKSREENNVKDPFMRDLCDSKLHIQQIKCENSSDCLIKQSNCSDNELFDKNDVVKTVSKKECSLLIKNKQSRRTSVLQDTSFKNNSDSTSYKRLTCCTENTSPSKKIAKSINVEIPFYSNSQSILKNKSIQIEKRVDFKENKVKKEGISNSDPDQFSSISKTAVNESQNTLKLCTKLSKKSKRFTPSQKLCLKSQRTDLGQSEHHNFSIMKDDFTTCSSQQKPIIEGNMLQTKNINASAISATSLSCLPFDSLGPTKVHTWLSHLPKLNNCGNADTKETNVHTNVVNQKSHPKSSQYNRRITIHVTPALRGPRTNYFNDAMNTCSESSSVENEDPNEDTVILSDKNVPFLPGKFKTPLQAWLKQELLSSINNTVGTSEDASKSIIVLATKTKDVVIYVGCSHMTCDSCYPNSTNLLLGYC